jgi:predicted transposase/invertase (TIGR01784 family)
MAFADLRNDYMFRRIFASHPEILRRLLNDLLERRGAQTIEQIEYLPGDQLPVVEGAKLSILDVRCRDREGTTFVVEMQLIHHPGFINRVVYNACKAYAGQLKEGEWYTKLTDVVAISICDFELWFPEAAQAVLTVLRVRGIAVPDAARERILAQRDLERLTRWLERATVVASIDDVLDEPS